MFDWVKYGWAIFYNLNVALGLFETENVLTFFIKFSVGDIRCEILHPVQQISNVHCTVIWKKYLNTEISN